MPSAFFWCLIAATIAQRLLELRRSSSNQTHMQRAGFTRVDSDASYALMVIVHCSWFVAMAYEGYFFPTAIPAVVRYTALLVFIGAQGLRLWSIRSLGDQWNTQVMKPLETGTDPGVVRSGPYHYIRHPNYLAVILEFLSLPLVGGAVLTALVWSTLNGAVLAYRIKLEERHLNTRDGYRNAVGQLPRLIPRLFPRTRDR